MSLHDLANEDAQHAADLGSPLAGSGAWARVISVDTGTHTVTVTVDDFDGGTARFGPVPHQADATIAAGDPVFLLVDSSGQPAGVLKF